MTDIKESRILIIATDGFEQSELEVPRDRLKQAGAKVTIASPSGDQICGWDKDDWGRPVPVDTAISAVSSNNFDALVIPGGQINPDKLRADKQAMAVVREFLDSGKPVAAICHGPWLLVEADALKGRDATSYHSIRRDVENAGGNWIDRDVVVDNGIITSRSPDDLDAFVAKIIEEVGEGPHPRQG
ncbi:MAG: type 1 glutamine amidotransferase domain-containing protein [Reyranellaceae bacterium]